MNSNFSITITGLALRLRLFLYYIFELYRFAWTVGDSNPTPPPCKGGALPNELTALIVSEQKTALFYQGKAKKSAKRVPNCPDNNGDAHELPHCVGAAVT